MKNTLFIVSLTSLIEKNIKGLILQVRNPIYLSEDAPELWRKIKKLKTYTEKGKRWVELHWIGKGESCTFTGCTIKSDVCKVQMDKETYNKIFNHQK